MRPVSAESSSHLLSRRAWLDYATVSWHATAAVISITAGFVADSIALTGFGLASIIQTAIAALLLWRFHREVRQQRGKEEHLVEQRILFILGVTFFLLALYILHESGSKLFYREKSETSKSGLVLSVLAFLAMLALAVLKLRSAKALESKMLRADAKENAIGTYPPLMLFSGLSLHAGYGWWWADPLAALFTLPFVIREGWKAIEDSKDSPFARETTKMI